jgi:parallel beta-helix repeat protein
MSLLAGVLVVLLTVASCLRDAEGPAPDDRSARGSAAEPTNRACVPLDGGRPFQVVVDEQPPGSCFTLPAGVHREQSVVPRDGDRFRGEVGAVWSGARLLEGWQQDEAGRWFVAGQELDGWVHPGTQLLPGREADNLPEELFVDGDRRLHRVTTLQQLGPGRWLHDPDRDRLYIGQDPGAFTSVEVSVTPFALAGQGIRDVVVEGITFEKFASPAQFAPVGGALDERWTHDWTIRAVTSRLNHGAGIVTGPGTTIEDSLVHGNGQIGITGDGIDRSDWGYAAPVTIRRTEVRDNGVLGFDWRWEAGGVKIKYALAGAAITDSWVHDNHGPGVWYDIDNTDVVIVRNLVERNGEAGILYEISFGSTRIEGNVVRGNGGPGVDISTSEGVEVSGNLLEDNGHGIHVRVGNRAGTEGPAGRRYDTRTVAVRGNDVGQPRGWSGYVTQDDVLRPSPEGITFEGNVWRLGPRSRTPFRWADQRLTAGGWSAAGHEVRPVLAPDDPAPRLEPVEALADRRYGAGS